MQINFHSLLWSYFPLTPLVNIGNLGKYFHRLLWSYLPRVPIFLSMIVCPIYWIYACYSTLYSHYFSPTNEYEHLYQSSTTWEITGKFVTYVRKLFLLWTHETILNTVCTVHDIISLTFKLILNNECEELYNCDYLYGSIHALHCLLLCMCVFILCLQM